MKTQPLILENVRSFLNTNTLSHFYGGAFFPSASGNVEDVWNPSDGSRLATISMGDKEDVIHAVAAAEVAFPQWADLSAVERAVWLHRLADCLEKHAAELAQIESLDVGKAIQAAESFDIPFGIACIRYFADLATHAQMDRPLAIKNMEARIHKTPYGGCD